MAMVQQAVVTKLKLFADMDKGKVDLKELTKVIEHIGTLTE